MSDDSKYGLMRKMDLNEPVSITLPAHVWRGFLSAYCSTRWSATDATSIMMEVQHALFDPRWMREQEAEMQRKQSEHNDLISRIIPGFPGAGSDDVPPDAGDFT